MKEKSNVVQQRSSQGTRYHEDGSLAIVILYYSAHICHAAADKIAGILPEGNHPTISCYTREVAQGKCLYF
jgi:hypothetical protein